ncbi:UNVERIFIED_CONTAM: hypothetical protein Slati_0909700, partial [Sesamum latifolium]
GWKFTRSHERLLDFGKLSISDDAMNILSILKILQKTMTIKSFQHLTKRIMAVLLTSAKSLMMIENNHQMKVILQALVLNGILNKINFTWGRCNVAWSYNPQHRGSTYW